MSTGTDAPKKGELIFTDPEARAEHEMFVLAQRQANVYASSDLVPAHYRGKVGNVLIATNMAKRMGADVLQVMQNLYIVHGNPGWSAQFLIATFNKSGRFSAVRYRFTGEKGTDTWGCIAYCREIESGDELEGTEVTIAMAKAEGWYGKNGSKWKTMPEQMLRYRSASYLIRTIAPEIGMGLQTADEIEDSHREGTRRSRGNLQSEPLSMGAIGSNMTEEAASTDTPETEPQDATNGQPSSDRQPGEFSPAFVSFRDRMNRTTKTSSLVSLKGEVEISADLSDDEHDSLMEELDERIAITKADEAEAPA